MSFEIRGGCLIAFTSDRHDVVVPEDVSEINNYVFFRRKRLHSIKIPANVRKIGDGAFYECINLKSVTLSEGLEEIGHSAFQGCENLFEITIPSSVRRIGDHAFSECKNLKTVNYLSSFADVSSHMFSDCIKLDSISLREGITSIENYAFSFCRNLRHVQLPASIKNIGNYAFGYCNTLKALDIPDGLETIGESAFNNKTVLYVSPGAAACNALNRERYIYREKEREFALVPIISFEGEKTGCKIADVDQLVRRVTIPEGVTHIGKRAFASCSMLEEVLIPDTVCYIGEEAFSHCTSLKTISIPGSVKIIGQNAFTYCKNLEGIKLHYGLESIWDSAFSWCECLKKIEIPDSVTEIRPSAFNNCVELEMAKLPTNLEVIHKEVFEDCKKLKQVVLPNGLKIIEKKAFIRCEALDEVDLREGLLFIGEDAFWGCKNLTTITIPASLKKMETGVFARCSKLKNFRVMEDNAFYTANCGLITGKLSGNLLFCLPAKEGECVLPEQITGIHSLAFSGCDDITRIVFPSGIRYFAKNAFVNFGAHLETVEISDVTTWLNIVVESRAHIHPLLYHYPNPFVNHAQMAINGQIVYDLIIPDGIKSIRDEAFKGCGSITSVYIPDSVIHLGNSCFDDCPNLKLVSISGEITGLMPHSLDFTNTDNKLTMRIRNHLGPELSKYISRRKELAIITDFQDIDFELLPSNARFSMTNRIAERLNNGESLSENLRNSYLSYLAKNKKYWISEPKESLVPAFQWMLREKILDIKEVNDLLKKISDFKEPLLMSALLEYSQGLSAEERGEHEQIDLDDIEMDILPANKLSETAYLRSHWMVSRGAGIVKKMKKTTENVVFPSKLGVKVLTEISDDFAFLDEEGRDARTQVKTITIPAGYERIGRNAFQGCTNLKEVVIENGLKHIGPCAFAKCKNLKKITIPGSVKTIDYGAFSSCTILEEVVVQEGVEVIDEDVFFMCNALKVIDIPSSVKIIMWRAFTKSGIEAVLVQGKNTLIQWPYAFEECRNYWIYAVPGFNADGLVPEIIIKPLEEYDKLCKQDDIVRPLNGKSFAVSGELKVLRDRDVEVLEETIEQLGGKLKDEVTETTTALITNYPASGTDLILTAKEYSIPIISETRFLNMIKMKRIKKRNTGDLY